MKKIFFLSLVYCKCLVVVCVALTSLSCTSFDGYTKNKPASKDLWGAWQPDAKTTDNLKQRGRFNTDIPVIFNVKEDGTFALSNMPDWWEDSYGASHQLRQSYNGYWELQETGGLWVILLKYNEKMKFFSILGSQSPYKFEAILGDPDSQNEMIFVKSK